MPADLARLDDRRRRRLYVELYTERFGRTPRTAPEYVPTHEAR